MADVSKRSPRRRNSLRLPTADYNQPAAYFITITTQKRRQLFGSIHEGQMICSRYGSVVWDVWRSLPAKYPDIEIDTAVVMPDHFHGIIIIKDMVGAIHESPLRTGVDKSPLRTGVDKSPLQRRKMKLPLVVGYLKMNAAREINRLRGTPGQTVWQRGYYDHILRDDRDYDALTEYILTNPQNLLVDKE